MPKSATAEVQKTNNHSIETILARAETSPTRVDGNTRL